MSGAGQYTFDQLLNALSYVESTNDYSKVGPETRRGNRAYGRFQVMDFNIPSWSEQHYGTRLTPQEFLANQEAQDAVFRGQMGEYYGQSTGTPEERIRNAGSLWFTGQPYSAETATRSDGYIDNQEYGDRILRALGAAPQGAETMTMTPDPEQQPQGFFGRVGQGLGELFPALRAAPDSSPTDPFEGLSRNQRMMLGFASIRDAAEALQGRQSSHFRDALGGFETARERERLRTQGEYQSQMQGLQALGQLRDQRRVIALRGGDTSDIDALIARTENFVFGGYGGETPQVTPAGGFGGPVMGTPLPTPTPTPAPTPAPTPTPTPETTFAETPTIGVAEGGPLPPVEEVPTGSAAILDQIAQLEAIQSELIAAGDPATDFTARINRLQRNYEAAVEAEAAAAAAEPTPEELEFDTAQLARLRSIEEASDEDLDLILGPVVSEVGADAPLAARILRNRVIGERGGELLADVEQITATEFLNAFNSLRGAGQITEREGTRAEQSRLQLSNRNVSPAAYRQAARELRMILENGLARSRGEEPPHSIEDIEAGVRGGPTGLSDDAMQFLNP